MRTARYLKTVVIGLAVVMFCAHVQAATYYIDSASGSNSNSGTSWANAWRSIDFGMATLFRGYDSANNYLYVRKDWQGANANDVQGFATSGSIALHEPISGNTQVVGYSAVSSGTDPYGTSSYRFELTSPLSYTTLFASTRVYNANGVTLGVGSTNAPYNPAGTRGGGFGFQPGDTIMLRGSWSLPSNPLNHTNELAKTDAYYTYKADAAGATIAQSGGSWFTHLAFIGANSIAFEGIDFAGTRRDQSHAFMRADRENIETWRMGNDPAKYAKGGEHMLFKNNKFRTDTQIAWTTLPGADWIGNRFYDLQSGGLAVYNGYKAENNIFHNIGEYDPSASYVSTVLTAAAGSTVRNNTFWNIGKDGNDVALVVSGNGALVENNVLSTISGTGIQVNTGIAATVDYNLVHSAITDYVNTTGGANKVIGNPHFVDPTSTRPGPFFPWPVVKLPDLHLLSPYGYYSGSLGAYVYNPLAPVTAGLDTGNPLSIYSNETAPNGGRINLGAYGNTNQNALSPVPIPEPASLALVALGCLALTRGRSKL